MSGSITVSLSIWKTEQIQPFADILFIDIENAIQKDCICPTFTEYWSKKI